ncbi:transporter substrate-binding domain-containing protein [Accumulibacter sp.]|uniref:substrate-binding periplasmic protein n=1 Tax=Accumulibacter sp. TaxID=2053492 RepID=UPI001AC42603|nr:transporter substrate-binding domain-containing protein [Accumulibacter sp.]MBN8454595.1 transporter substrate-binding domain-containing protein [Accumulibacter sp.]MBO3707040.1 transporter substrate-binding domain-containing protein [Candidatus Accumulibacter conexus]
MRILTLLLAALVVCAPHALAQGQARPKELRLLAAELPPYTFQVPPASVSETPGVDHGLVLEVVSEMARRLGHSGLVEFMPWGEAQRLAQTQPNIGILALTRTPEREDRYRWLARIVTDDLILVGGQGIDVSSLDRVRERPVGVLGRSGAEALLKERGFSRIKAQPEEWMNARLMQQRRIDAWLAPRLMVIHAMREVGGNLAALNFGEIVRPSEIYLAASRDLPDAEALKWEKALAAMKADGSYQRIVDEYSRLQITPIPDELRRRFAQPVWEGR